MGQSHLVKAHLCLSCLQAGLRKTDVVACHHDQGLIAGKRGGRLRSGCSSPIIILGVKPRLPLVEPRLDALQLLFLKIKLVTDNRVLGSGEVALIMAICLRAT